MFAVLGWLAAAEAVSNADAASVALWVAVISTVGTVVTGIIAAFAAVASRGARHELKPNGGASTRDAIDQLRASLDEHREESQAHRTHVNGRLEALEVKAAAPVQVVGHLGHVAPIEETP